MKAIALISGGLDSILAAKIILDQGIEVIGLSCVTPFSVCAHKEDCGCVVRRAAKKLGIELAVIDLAQDFLDMLENPSHGYGSNMNPCIDCKILMLKKAKELMQKIGAQFIVTGEVLGQRPMSQKGQAMKLIEEQSGTQGVLVRPLSAKLLEPAEPEKSGWINREKLFAISGRGRKDQLVLAAQLNIDDYSAPAGGCLLTYEGYSKKVRDLIRHNQLTLDNVSLLKIGRHFRISPKHKLIVGRDEEENIRLFALAEKGNLVYEPDDEIRGPVALGRGEISSEAEIEQCCRIVARYCDDNNRELEIIAKKRGEDFQKSFICLPLEDSKLRALRI
ncbi:MAG: tRNA 4-thiouridine(8) synthase ThiI [Candidatus Omnitrophica bacterium]|nr:tRNA 4-thiouridine(8) synthase ThiI [Candidatus Omnitrophota bacterium]